MLHFQATNHPLTFGLIDGKCHCYECNDWVLHDNQSADLQIFREMLSSMQRNESTARTTRSGRVHTPATPLVETRALERKASFFTKAEQEKADMQVRPFVHPSIHPSVRPPIHSSIHPAAAAAPYNCRSDYWRLVSSIAHRMQ